MVDYILDGNAIIGEKRTLSGIASYSYTLYYMYDECGNVIGFTYKAGNNSANEYYYGKNLQGDIVAIYDVNGVKQVGYVYDAWGNIASVTGNLASTVGAVNPFRYRSYYYDNESGLYYLNARYYDPILCRFISPDRILGANKDLHSYNLYAYCSNNPVMYSDPSGYYYDDYVFDPIRDILEHTMGGAWGWGGSSIVGIGGYYDSYPGNMTYGGGGSVVLPGANIPITPEKIIKGIAIALTASIAISKANEKEKVENKEKDEIDPYARPGQKKQDRERKNKNRRKDNFTPKSKPQKPKHHTPGRDQRKFN